MQRVYHTAFRFGLQLKNRGHKETRRERGLAAGVAERMRLERTMPCGTPHFQCGSLPLEYLSNSRGFNIIAKIREKINPFFKKSFKNRKKNKAFT